MSTPSRFYLLTFLAMIAFASNSILCRLALKGTKLDVDNLERIDPATFTLTRIVSGAITLWLIVLLRNKKMSIGGDWKSSIALFVYAAGFSLAYTQLSAGLGTLLLFGAVQVTMICYGLYKGEKLTPLQSIGLLSALGGLFGLCLPGISKPPIKEVLLMSTAGIAWGVYSIRGKGTGDPSEVTAGNFVRAIPFSMIFLLLNMNSITPESRGLMFAVASGAITSGIGYVIWYAAIKGLNATTAATVQLSVPVIATIGGILFLNEDLTTRLIIAGFFILTGIMLVIKFKRVPQPVQSNGK